MAEERGSPGSHGARAGPSRGSDPAGLDLLAYYEDREAGEAAIRAVGSGFLDLIVEYLYDHGLIRSSPPVTPADLDALLDSPLPLEGAPLELILDEVREKILPHGTNMVHPRHWGLMNPSPLLLPAFADALASVMNQNCGGWRASPAATHVEKQVIEWLCQVVGYPQEAFGLLVSGGSMANLIALKMARDIGGERGIREEGMRAAGQSYRIYSSEEVHFSVDRALDVLGLGSEALVRIPTDSRFRLLPEALEEAVGRDREDGLVPLAVVATAGTTNSGAFDPLPPLADVAGQHGLWLHVDAAYGGGLLLSQRWGHLLEGIARADSITLDPHKTLFQPLDVGALLVRDRRYLERAFGFRPAYLAEERKPGGERLDFFPLGIEGSRRFRALKLWLTLKVLGVRRLGALIDRNVELTEYLKARVEASDDLEGLEGASAWGIYCFRYKPAGVRAQELDRLQAAIQGELEREGKAWLATTRIQSRTYLRANIINYVTQPSDVDAVLESIREVGGRL